MEVGRMLGSFILSPCSKRRLFIISVTSLTCMTTPCPTTGWPLVTWKGSAAHVPLSVQAKLLKPLLMTTP
ncbi:unnamed protein product [Spirodela intermedia]|uniref:Uncharacterized protein n=1 Tax=Spirodela intermedia TaxID=51605 RepID=A0ABN7EA76_SPIIN|nr:unnamed protein product [Spirodela intermedia]